MKRNIILTVMILAGMFVLSGCADAVFEIKINSDGSLNADYEISALEEYADGLNPEIVEKLKEAYTESDYKAVVKNGVISVKKDNIRFDTNKFAVINNYKIDPLGYVLDNAENNQEFLKNTIVIDTSVDLSDFESNAALLYDELESREADGQTEPEDAEQSSDASDGDGERQADASKTDGEALKSLADMKLKLVIKTEGKIVNTNSESVSEDLKEASWLLTPGEDNKIFLECTTGFNKNYVGTAFILGLTAVLAVFLLILLFVIYGRYKSSEGKK